jgi:hypothetical protein
MPENLQRSIVYWRSVNVLAWSNYFAWGIKLMLSVVLAFAILALQFYYGVFSTRIHERWLSIVWPYLAVLAVGYIFQVARAAWLIDEERQKTIAGERDRGDLEKERADQTQLQLSRSVPDIMMEWRSTDRSEDKDFIILRNSGKSLAANVTIGNMSWHELTLLGVNEIQHIEPGGMDTLHPRLTRREASGNLVIERMFGCLRSCAESHAEPLSIEVQFLDINRSRFTRKFTFRLSTGANSAVLLDLGELEVRQYSMLLPSPLDASIPQS